MRATGIVRRVDELGRIVIPIELRRELEIAPRDPIEIWVDGDQTVLRKYRPGCIFCGKPEDMGEFMGKNVCRRCIAAMPEPPSAVARQE